LSSPSILAILAGRDGVSSTKMAIYDDRDHLPTLKTVQSKRRMRLGFQFERPAVDFLQQSNQPKLTCLDSLRRPSVLQTGLATLKFTKEGSKLLFYMTHRIQQQHQELIFTRKIHSRQTMASVENILHVILTGT
jgi:hypothetical protein